MGDLALQVTLPVVWNSFHYKPLCKLVIWNSKQSTITSQKQ
uniref:Uncharacterized protein n=1 Tax=Anguilla anguilla TaxID=7936 RepID=A0A0E9WFL7_ANGAN